MKFTFKRQPKERGLAAVARPYPSVEVKYKGKQMGVIHPPPAPYMKQPHKWSAGIMVKAEKGWNWSFFVKKFETEEEAREFFQANIEFILARDLHYLED